MRSSGFSCGYDAALLDLLEQRHSAQSLPPALLRFRVSESLSASEFYRIGSGCARLVAEHLKRAGLSLGANERILDFGCGCGRTLIPLSAQYPNVSWHAVDVDREAVLWCQDHLPNVQTECILYEPPFDLGDHLFDAIYCFSVFTHLDEELQDKWIDYLGESLKPGGILLLTVHGANAVEGFDGIGKKALESTGFLHRTSTKLKGVVPERYHTTWHTRDYITSKLAGLIGPTEYVVVADGLQDLVIARKARTP